MIYFGSNGPSNDKVSARGHSCTSSGLGRVLVSRLLWDKFRIGSSPKFEAALGRLHHRGRAQREDAGLSTFVLGSAFVALDADRFEGEQDGFITEAAFDAQFLIR